MYLHIHIHSRNVHTAANPSIHPHTRPHHMREWSHQQAGRQADGQAGRRSINLPSIHPSMPQPMLSGIHPSIQTCNVWEWECDDRGVGWRQAGPLLSLYISPSALPFSMNSQHTDGSQARRQAM
mmetsp:Transcript_46223/g.114996  ORF Transcript_46223/g.114996 Transcript_46223/m.114996 type:complete len:124 (-) Transcript_46223:356-727(-)